ncbi:serine hydrolase [Flavobacterium sp. ov086]|uniref:serine hydrolase domain-containing protein n=1 Tax=Flavobacterium sp. ov086 TaxID=1761785 RepID=UPI000B6DA0CB|nr:serine hydrolase [Flavobacterium sp. ov086]SNR44709.1 CubicO group peptidase, beta-lactamase class C family [Flavobacterium sp. ov086]
MKKTNLLLLFLLIIYSGYSQEKYKITYDQLKEYEGIYEYQNKTTLQIAASPKDTILYAIINESKYALKPSEKDVFLNMSKEKVTFLRDPASVINGYSSEEKTYKVISKKVVFPKEMWYPRLNASKDYKYVYQQPKKDLDGLVTGPLDNTGLDKTLLNEMMQKIVDGTYQNVHSVLIIKDGKLVFEEYFYDNNKAKLHELRSATKSFVSALTGIAIDKGFIKDKSETVLSYFSDYTFKNLTDDKKQITIENLLTNQSGLDCDVSNPKSEGNETIMNYSDDWIQYTLDLPMVDVPGGKGMYCSGNPITMGKIIERATKMPLPEFAKQTLFKDLGIKNFKWNFKPDASSAETFCQVYLSSRDMAKFGLLYLNKGLWNGKQVVSKDWVEQSLTKHSVVQGVNYGYLWWIKYLNVDGVKYNGKAAQGNGGQKIYIWEDQNMITVITGGNYNSQSPSDELIQKYILPSFNAKKGVN